MYLSIFPFSKIKSELLHEAEKELTMTVNYFIKCPACGTITRIRTPAGYVYSTPVRIHCGKCDTLLTGEFISDNKRFKAYYIPSNCEQVDFQAYEYYGEASGELLSNKIEYFPGDGTDYLPPKPSPVFAFMDSMSQHDKDNFINYVCYCEYLKKNWDMEQIKYKLYKNGQAELIKKKFAKSAEECGYTLDSDFDVLRYIYYSFFFDCGGIFKEKILINKLIEINRHFRHLNKTALRDFICELESSSRLSSAQNKVFEVFFAFVQVSMNLAPAIGANLYDEPSSIDKSLLGLTTCTFLDIKQFYQDTYESLLESSDIVIGLDNIEARESFNSFKTKLDMSKFRNQKKGNKIKFLDQHEFFSGEFNMMLDSPDLRNAIGHNDYTYTGTTQIVDYGVSSQGIRKQSYLLDIAIECVQLMQSAFILGFYIYELYRYKQRVEDGGILLNPVFYRKSKGQDHCPCGSGKKYKNCCKVTIESHKKKFNREYPHKSSMTSTIGV